MILVVDKDFLDILVNFGENDKKIGFLGPKVYYYEFDHQSNIIQSAGNKQSLSFFHSKIRGDFEIDNGQYNESEIVDFIQGSCILAKSEMIKEIGMLDEDFFSYREENDWGIRGNNHGWNSLYVPYSKIWHKGGKSSGGQLSYINIFYITRNDFLIVKKHGSILQQLSLHIFYFFKIWFAFGQYVIYHKNFKAFRAFLDGYKAGFMWKK